jgi:F-type H+-transporting ATPase subunit b
MNALFEAFGINGSLLLIQAVNFGALLLALWYFLYTPVLKMIDERRAKIAEGVRMAEAASQRLADATTESEGIIGGAARNAEELVANGRQRGIEKEAELLKIAEARAESVVKEAVARGEEIKRQVMSESEREVARAAMLAAEKILKARNA